MQFQTFDSIPQATYEIAILVPKLESQGMRREYLDPGMLETTEVIAYQLLKTDKKTLSAVQKQYLDELLPMLDELGSQYLLVGDGEYFKTLTGVAKADAYLGYVLPNTYPAHMKGRFQVLYVPNYRQVIYDPGKTRARIQQSLDALWSHRHGQYRTPGCSIIEFSAYPSSVLDIASWLDKLIQMDVSLTCDIECFSLKHYSAGIGTIGFAWSKTEGIAFPVDLSENPAEVRKLLIRFFRLFRGNLKFHSLSFDVTVLVYQLFMKHILDTAGLLDGLDVFLDRDFDCTKIISYLATNSCAGNELGLKVQSQEYSGNYAQDDIKDITKIPLPQLLEYNLVDCLATWFVYEKNHPVMVHDQQLEIYETLFRPALIDIVQMQLTGMPLDMLKVQEAKELLGGERAEALHRIQNNILVQEYRLQLQQEHVDKRNSELKTKRITLSDAEVALVEFNPNSSPQRQALLYEMIGLPVIERTKTKQPATGAEVLEKLKAHTTLQKVHELLDALLDFAAVEKIYSTFIPAMEGAVLGPDGWHYLFGNFNLGGTVSGRLSSSDPNLQTIPANGKTDTKVRYAKIVKGCFVAPPGKLFVGLDFSSLEDKISALTTKDTQKLKVYTDGYDGHCLRAFSYFGDQMPDIDGNSVDSINSIAVKYKPLRQESKTPTFLLTYDGTFIGMMAQCGFSKEKAQAIEAKYHELYKESDAWVSAKLDEASKTGYVTVAFGLRVRTPLLSQVVRKTSATPFEAQAEGRTAGNALGQSWGLLNTRASIEFMREVRAHPVYRLMVGPSAHIHDAQYLLMDDDIELLSWVNERLVHAVQWQDHPDIHHDTVKIGGSLSLFFPSWNHDAELPNGATEDQIYDIVSDHLDKLTSKGIPF